MSAAAIRPKLTKLTNPHRRPFMRTDARSDRSLAVTANVGEHSRVSERPGTSVVRPFSRVRVRALELSTLATFAMGIPPPASHIADT